jgi:hypothetical protein
MSELYGVAKAERRMTRSSTHNLCQRLYQKKLVQQCRSQPHMPSVAPTDGANNVAEASSSDLPSTAKSSNAHGEDAAVEVSEKPTEGTVIDDEAWLHHSQNPHNWPVLKKWSQAGIVSAYTFVS